ncbi:MAG: SAM-dependent methyltransferase [Microbacter sp.]
MPGILYLIPVPLGESESTKLFPPYNETLIKTLSHFIVEDVRSARRFLKRMDAKININELTFLTLNEQTRAQEIPALIQPLLQGISVGLLSEAGCPAVADPGSAAVDLAQKAGIQVVPLIGPSSILLSLMASGLNGQNFAFVGYLPIENAARIKMLKALEKRSSVENQTQIFIETPYRNDKMMNELLQHLSPNTRLCVASEVSLPNESIQTKTIAEWKREIPNLNKKPVVFLISGATH